MLFAGSSRTAALDGLRGLAALAVFVFHAWLYTLPEPRADDRDALSDFVLHELRLGLVLFFVLSGYLLYRPWVEAALGDGRRPRVGAYLRRRAARILPAYYAALAGSVALLWGLEGAPGVRLPPAEGLPLFAVFAQNASDETVMRLDPPMWTLAVEVSFYVVLPVVGALALLLGRGLARQCLVPLGLALAGLCWNAWLALEAPGLPYVKSLPAMLPYFACGMLAAVLAHGRAGSRAARRCALAAAGLLVVLDAAWHGSVAAAGERSELAVLVRDIPAGVGFAILVGLAASAAGRRAPRPGLLSSRPGLLSSRPLVRLGIVSYGFYLWHVPVLLWLRANGLLPLDPLGAAVVGGAASVLVAAASWSWIERPAIAWARRSDSRAAAAERPPAAAARRSGARPPAPAAVRVGSRHTG